MGSSKEFLYIAPMGIRGEFYSLGIPFLEFISLKFLWGSSTDKINDRAISFSTCLKVPNRHLGSTGARQVILVIKQAKGSRSIQIILLLLVRASIAAIPEPQKGLATSPSGGRSA